MNQSEHHIVPIKTYFKVFISLLLLTLLTVVVARPVSGFDAGIFNAFIAFAIATLKASLVLAFFMGLKYDKKQNLVIFLAGVFFVIIMFAFCILDIYSRIQVTGSL
ncbi:MAG: hypothetical protein A2Z20_04285 [Bdellovibrionales bacterium RBG_16_40_8]|nr:MAG: hypothetical protein A2Z20_04285 [Bdellovibrionales bacterium RBG_16_40_8]